MCASCHVVIGPYAFRCGNIDVILWEVMWCVWFVGLLSYERYLTSEGIHLGNKLTRVYAF